MRELVYVPIVHDIPTFSINENDEENKKQAALFSQKLRPAFNLLTKRILEMHGKQPFRRIYLDGCLKPTSFYKFASESAAGVPVMGLISLGVELMPTEHEGSLLLPFFLGCNDEASFEERKLAFEYIARIKNFSMQKFRASLKDLFDDSELSSLLLGKFDDFFLGCEYADFHAARELWIGRNIEQSLRDNERGLLFLGTDHSYERVKSTITSPINHVYYDFFGFNK
ncbi:hypothetical protein HZA98_02215 [Candidatus Woesearchaeota archaeon]|nr:hypothetical protein [Candidatus Woesearchaeota archaeon]